jgi:lipoprotein NlpI
VNDFTIFEHGFLRTCTDELPENFSHISEVVQCGFRQKVSALGVYWLRFLEGKINAADLLRACNKGGDAGSVSAAHYFIAEKFLAEGKIDEAKKEFRDTLKRGSESYWQVTFAKKELQLLGEKVDEESSGNKPDDKGES